MSALAKYSGCADVQCAVPCGDDLTFIEEHVLALQSRISALWMYFWMYNSRILLVVPRSQTERCHRYQLSLKVNLALHPDINRRCRVQPEIFSQRSVFGAGFELQSTALGIM